MVEQTTCGDRGDEGYFLKQFYFRAALAILTFGHHTYIHQLKGLAMTSVKSMTENRPLFAVERTTSVQTAAEYLAKNNIGAVPVMEGTRLVGIFSERDVINRVVAKGLDPKSTAVEDVMTTNIVVAAADETHEDCLKKMKQANCRHLPVVEGDALLGMISLRDLLQVDIHEKDDKIEFLNNYMFHVPPGLEKKYAR